MSRLCPQCGVVAPERGRQCAVCELPLGSNTLEWPYVAPGMVLASVWCWARCPSCEAEIPIDRFDDDRAVCPSCGKVCGLRGVSRALEHAHAVGDLASADGEGRFPDGLVSIAVENPFSLAGRTSALFESAGEGETVAQGIPCVAVSARATPGHPLCEECHEPLELSLEGPGAVAARCTGCALRFVSRVPAHAIEALGEARAIVALPHRDDRPVAAITEDDDGRPRDLLCPDCTATLPRLLERRVLRCPVCRTLAVVPPELWRVPSRDALALYRTWAVFEGPSRLRGELVRNARKRAAREEQARDERAREEEARRRERAAREEQAREERAREDQAREERARARAEEVQQGFRNSFALMGEEQRRLRRRNIALGAVLGVAAAVITLAALFVRS